MTTTKKISSLFNIQPSFLRSVNVALDYGESASSQHYVATDFVIEVLTRICSSLRCNSSERAWRITGDYGSGKSAFALAFARIAAGQRTTLPRALHAFVAKDLRLEPVLVSGTPESLEKSIRKGLADLRRRTLRRSVKSLEDVTSGQDALIALLDAHADFLRKDDLADGLLLVLDELGQNLQHAATHPSDGDISLLQRLGEKAARSGSKPFVVVGLLHQGINAYSADLDVTGRREWEKVSGRFNEIVFSQPIEQVATLVTEMLGVKSSDLPRLVRQETYSGMEQAISCGLYGAAAAKDFLLSISNQFYPLHPTVFPILIRLLRRFGQNERSLVGFLSSYEPFGFREFSENHAIGSELFRLHNLYDYFKANLAASLFNGHASHWEVISAAVANVQGFGEPSVSVIKTIALINLINDPAIVATESMVRSAVGHPDVAAALRKLRTTSALIHIRGNSNGLSLWPHSSVNLDNAFEQADEALASETFGARAVAAHLKNHNVVARRHYIETGNLRHFTTAYIDFRTLRECLTSKFPVTPAADGQVFVVLTNDEEEKKQAETLLSDNHTRLGELTVIGVSSAVTGVAGTIRDLKRWLWIKSNLKELAGDIYARNHVNREIKRCEHRIEKELQYLFQLRNGSNENASIFWFDITGRIRSSATKGILPHLSDRCDKVYHRCPRIPNELINRRVTSAAASKARSILIEAIAVAGDKENLGFNPDKFPPEFAIYLSVLKAGRIHVKDGGAWRFRNVEELRQDDPLRLGHSLRHVHERLVNADTRRCKAVELFDSLRAEPYGVKDGLLPLLLALYLAGQWDQTALYEDGTFMEKPGSDVFQRLAKEPEAFDLQHCSVRGVRRELFTQVATVLGLPKPQKPDILTIVRPLMVFAARLSEYSLHTEQHIKPSTKKLREVLLPSREPATLLFQELPKALSFEPFAAEKSTSTAADAAAFADALHAAILDLRESYPRLLGRINESVLAAFRFHGTIAEFRAQFTVRFKAVSQSMTDPELRVFGSRLGDPVLADREWAESIATYVARKTPDHWRDLDEDEFHSRIGSLAGRFQRAEAAGFNGKAIDPEKIGRAVRFTLTRPDGREVDHVIHWTSRDEASIEDGKSQLRSLIQRLGPMGMAAAAEFVWESLQQKKP